METTFIDTYYHWFNSYVKNFYGEDKTVNQNIELKEIHTLKVSQHAVNIAKSLDLSEKEVNISEIIGLFHDIGRFEQFKKYKTFKDSLSENHALLGIKVLQQHNVLKDLDDSIKAIIIKAISLHNTKELPDALTTEEALYCKLIRDADKLDIFRVVIEYEKERQVNPNPAIDDLPFTDDYNKALLEDIYTGRKINVNLLQNYNDRKLYELGWIKDLNFPFSLRYIKEKDILKNLINCLPKNKEINSIYLHLSNYIDTLTSK